MTFDQLCEECLFKGGGGGMKSILLLSEEKEEAYPTNVVDLWVVACKPIILAGNQSCSQCYELVKCVTCQGVLAGVFFLGLVNKGYILGTRPSVALTKEEPNSQRLSFIARVLLFSAFFPSEEMRWERDQRPGKPYVGFSYVIRVCLSYCKLYDCILWQ